MVCLLVDGYSRSAPEVLYLGRRFHGRREGARNEHGRSRSVHCKHSTTSNGGAQRSRAKQVQTHMCVSAIDKDYATPSIVFPRNEGLWDGIRASGSAEKAVNPHNSSCDASVPSEEW